MSSLSREEAFEFVDSIRLDNGGTTEEDRKGAQPGLLKALANTRKQLAAVTETYIVLVKPVVELHHLTLLASLAVQIYTKSTRFVYELVQNAEDNSYKVEKRLDKKPFLRFSVTREKIIIDSNEDGFSEKNVESICKIGISTKKGIRGYIGEKGIGFKSVFTVASNVRVQSGPFAFYFNYDGGADGDGLGLITPFNCDHEDLPEGVRTRMTLTLKDDLDYGNLVKEFTDLPDTLLLFLTTLKRLQTSIHDGHTLHERRYEFLHRENSGRGRIVVYANGGEQTDLRFFIRKMKICDLPAERTRKDISDAEVVLAFPVDGDDNPVIEPQHVCAYLPLRRIGLPFQVQSDFVTQASREDLLDCPWNRALRDGTSAVFVDAILNFCQIPTLQYVWPRYLPAQSVVDPFWAQLRDMITSRLKLLPILRTHESEALKCIGQLRFLPPACCDQEGKPLFEDLPDEIYLSSQYSAQEQATLQTIGLQTISTDQFWERLEADLRSTSSKMKNPQTSESWHISCAVLIFSLANRSPQMLEKIQSLEIIPLRDGTWTSIKRGPVFYNNIAGIKIPVDLGLRILDSRAAALTAREKLFDTVGVKYCDIGQIKKLIVGKYAKWNNVDLASSVSHLNFLFHLCPENEQPIDKTMFLFNANKIPVYRVRVALGRPEMVVDDIYFDTPGAYQAKAICPEGLDANGFNIHIIHPAYMVFEEAKSSLHKLSYKDWLRKHGGVLQVPRLVDAHKPANLSALFEWIIRRRPELLLGVLKTHWKTYAGLIKDLLESTDPVILTTLRNVKLRCNNREQVSLHSTFLPLEKLLKLAVKLDIKEDVRFLQLPSDLPEASLKDWKFLSTFGTGSENNLDFYLEALRSISSRKSQSHSRKILIEIYEAIATRAKYEDYKRVQEFFQAEKVINAKYGVEQQYFWVRLGKCVCKGPDFLNLYCVLYKDDDFRKSGGCKDLFARVLHIPDAGWSHILKQITEEKSRYDRKKLPNTATRISMIYHGLNADESENIDWEHICEEFENKQLIYVPDHGWQPPSKCVWTDHNYVADIFPISGLYHNLETFFVKKLQVPSPTLQSQLMELQDLCNNAQPISEKFSSVKLLMKEINIWEPKSKDVSDLLDKTVIPIIDEIGDYRLVQPNGTFAIVDNEKYRNMFSGKVSIFAIPFDEICDVRHFLLALGSESRYMSRLVSETSEAKDSFADRAMSEQLRKRAYAIVRCAIYFGSPKIGSTGLELYNLLRKITIYQTDEVATVVSLELEGHVIATKCSTGIIHVVSDGSSLRLYIPKDKKKSRVSFLTRVPAQLMAHLSINDASGEKVVSDVLKADLDDIDYLLQELGIPEVLDLKQLIETDLEKGYFHSDDEWDNQNLDESNSRRISSSLAPTISSMSSFRSSRSVTPAPTISRATTPDARNSSFSPGRGFSSPGLSSRVNEAVVNHLDSYATQYKLLLDKVITAGENGELPSNFGFAISGSNASTTVTVDADTIFGIRSEDMMAHDMRIGAAGELYAFEVLQYHLDSLDITNWRSTIRHHVAVHQKYSRLTAWTGRETADIVYEDHTSDYTRLMISYGYLPNFQMWGGQKPTYYIEVKTTTGPCDTRFFMSKAQVRRMRKMRLDPNRPSADIYMILRVYNIAGNRIGMRILLDPATLEQEGKLVVEAEQYTVAQPRS